MRLIIKFPTFGRPERFFETLDIYYKNLSNRVDVKFLVSCDTHDTTMNNDSIIEKFSNYKNLEVNFFNNTSKIEAINCDLDGRDFDIILLASDDMIPVIPEYDEIIVGCMRRYYPDTDGVIWFNDGLQGMRLNTLSIMGKKYYDRFGYIYHPSYKSFYCDTEFTDVSIRLGRVVYFDYVLIKHNHVTINLDLNDSTYKKNNAFLNEDEGNYIKRKLLNYGH